MTDYDDALRIRSSLSRSWTPLLARFGSLTPVQLQVIPRVLAGQNLLISAPTASGKTEAVVAPICELLLKEGLTGLRCLYVSPTRALVNDLMQRLKEPLKEMDLGLGVWTGDHHNFNPEDPEEFLLVTPESFDSVLCRFSRLFEGVKFAVFDEIHLIDGTYRGDQLAILAKRLRMMSKAARFYGLSATVKDLDGVAKLYLGHADAVQITGGREIREHYVRGEDVAESLAEAVDQFRRLGLSKVLFFCNSRAETERIGHKLGSYVEDYRVIVHHGSLPKDRREASERALREMRFCFGVATTTLEVGIDIGDFDAIALVGVPPTISSLLQRVGRGNRRQGFVNVFAIAKTESESALFKAMLALVRSGELETVSRSPCMSVAVQQVLSIAFQTRASGFRESDASALMKGLELTDGDISNVIEHLKSLGYLVARRSLTFPTTKTLDLAMLGKIHSNIGDEHAYKVIDRRTGETVGEIGFFDAQSNQLILGGKLWRVVHISGNEVAVEPGSGAPGELQQFSRRRNVGQFYGLLPEAIRRRAAC